MAISHIAERPSSDLIICWNGQVYRPTNAVGPATKDTGLAKILALPTLKDQVVMTSKTPRPAERCRHAMNRTVEWLKSNARRIVTEVSSGGTS